ncbi:MAG: hypothetical protein ACE5PO_09120 [Candidatus Bathyarchaeia archaeon]
MENDKAYQQLLLATLTEYEKDLGRLISRMEETVAAISKLRRAALNPVEPEESFVDKVREVLLRLPKGWNFEVSRVEHVAHVKITWTEPKE